MLTGGLEDSTLSSMFQKEYKKKNEKEKKCLGNPYTFQHTHKGNPRRKGEKETGREYLKK